MRSTFLPEMKFDVMGIFMHYDKVRIMDFFKKYCPSKVQIFDCLDKQMFDLKDCVDTDLLNEYHFGNNALKSFINYICKTDGDMMARE